VVAEKVTFTAERETALLTLYGKARQSASADPILPDP
jgi:O-methyltransferase involved in polyketide biosynthesis